MELRSIINQVFPSQPNIKTNKIVHQLNNQGCRCDLCQKIVVTQNKVIKTYPIVDYESEYTKGQKQSFWIPFLLDYFSMDRMPRKVKFLIPQICIFEGGAPTTLITKKKDNMPMKIIKNKEKLNAFEIQNFFTDGYITHNNVKNDKQGRFRSMSRQQYYNYWDQLKNECVVLGKFNNGSYQMMNMIELTNLFKSKQRQTRKELSALITMVNAKDHNEIRVPVEINPNLHTPLYERAKTEVKMINEDIKPKDFMYVSQKEQKAFEDQLRQRDVKGYLQYISIKLLLLYSIKTDVLVKSSLFKYIKGQGNSYYLTDIQAYDKGKAVYVWGEVRQQTEQQRMPTSPGKQRVRPSSSPERLQKLVMNKLADKGEENRQDKGFSLRLNKENDKIKALLTGGRSRAYTGFKLEPVKNNKFSVRK